MLPLFCALVFALVVLVRQGSGSFTYLSFNDTSGLRLNGDAATSSCEDGGPYHYSAVYGTGDGTSDGGLDVRLEEGTSTRSETRTLSFGSSPQTGSGARLLAGFPSRDAFGGSPDNTTGPCPVRLRLTPSRAFKTASVLHLESQPVLGGFETGFSFQLTDPSTQCTQVKDATFGAASHRACTVAGGDGLAFVLHGDPRTASRAMGQGGGGLGYAGLPSALAVEFDTWYNAEGGGASGDLPYDHVCVQASPADGGTGAQTSPNTPLITSGTATRISAAPLRLDLGDGLVHTVRIAYYPYLKMDFLPRFSASTVLPQFLTAEAERRRIGTLAVWVDEVEAATGEVAGAGPGSARQRGLLPSLAVPLNLNSALRLAGLEAWAGFTASTGSTAWQKHDLLHWYWCDAPECA